MGTLTGPDLTSTGGVVVLFHPTEDARASIEAALTQVNVLWVVDNTPEASDVGKWAQRQSRVRYVHRGRNLGLGLAYDLAFQAADGLGMTWMVVLDQDTLLYEDYLEIMATRIRESISAFDRPIGVIGPNFVNPRDVEVPDASGRVQEVTMVISSGSLVPLAAWRSLGGFHQGLLVDYVDIEFCLRARNHGLAVLRTPDVLMTHAMGYTTESRVLGVYTRRSSNYPATRHYYVARNLILTARSAGGWRWAVAELWRRMRFVVLTLAIESGRRPKARAMVTGLLDGIRGVQGERVARGGRRP